MTYLLNLQPAANNGSWSNIADVLIQPRQLIHSEQTINQLVAGQLYEERPDDFLPRDSSTIKSKASVISTTIQSYFTFYIVVLIVLILMDY